MPDGPSYQLSEPELAKLTADLVATKSTGDSPHQFLCFRVPGDSVYANIGRHIEREVFESSFGNSSETMALEYGAYDISNRSTFFITIDRRELVAAGTARMIHNSAAGFKTLNDLDKFLMIPSGGSAVSQFQAQHGVANLDACWDHATLAVRKPFRHAGAFAGISVQLHRASYVSALELGIDHLVSILDIRALKQIRDFLGVPFAPLCETPGFPYLGSAHSQAVYGFYPEFLSIMSSWRRFQPKRLLARHAYRELVLGAKDEALMLGGHAAPAH